MQPSSNRSAVDRRGVPLILGVAAVLLICFGSWLIRSRSLQKPVRSSNPEFSQRASRVRWMERRLVVTPPSPIRDARFEELDVDHPHTHMGPGERSSWFMARIDIDPADVEKWAALTTPGEFPRWQPNLNPLLAPGRDWSIDPAELIGARFLDPDPIVGHSARRNYQAGYLVVPAGGSPIYIWQHWR